MKKCWVILFFVFLIGFVSSATYYVSPTGQAAWGDCDGDVALSGAVACSAQTAMSNAKGGDLVYFRGGVYHKRISFKNDGANSEVDRIVIAGYPGDVMPIVDGEYNLPNFGSCNSDADCTRFAGLKCDINYHVCGNGGCDPKSGNCSTADGMMKIQGKYITIDGFEVMRSFGRGIQVEQTGGNNIIKNCVVHDNRGSGILIYRAGSNHLIENNSVWESGNFARYSRGASQLNWPGGIAVRATNNVTIKNNEVFRNWGEGIMPMNSVGTNILGNVVYDNYAVQIYPASSPNTLIEGNLVFNSGDPTYFRGGKPCSGIWFADEPKECNISKEIAKRSDNMTIINNLVAGNSRNIWVSGGCENEGNTIRSLVANNILIDAKEESIYLYEKNGENEISKVFNNIIYDSEDFKIYSSPNSGFEFSNNLWSNAPVFPNNVNRPDNLLVGNPGIVGLSQIQNILPKEKMLAEWFKINGDSLARNKGRVISEVDYDYFGNVRDSSPDIGAIEFVDGEVEIPDDGVRVEDVFAEIEKWKKGEVSLSDVFVVIRAWGNNL